MMYSAPVAMHRMHSAATCALVLYTACSLALPAAAACCTAVNGAAAGNAVTRTCSTPSAHNGPGYPASAIGAPHAPVVAFHARCSSRHSDHTDGTASCTARRTALLGDDVSALCSAGAAHVVPYCSAMAPSSGRGVTGKHTARGTKVYACAPSVRAPRVPGNGSAVCTYTTRGTATRMAAPAASAALHAPMPRYCSTNATRSATPWCRGASTHGNDGARGAGVAARGACNSAVHAAVPPFRAMTPPPTLSRTASYSPMVCRDAYGGSCCAVVRTALGASGYCMHAACICP